MNRPSGMPTRAASPKPLQRGRATCRSCSADALAVRARRRERVGRGASRSAAQASAGAGRSGLRHETSAHEPDEARRCRACPPEATEDRRRRDGRRRLVSAVQARVRASSSVDGRARVGWRRRRPVAMRRWSRRHGRVDLLVRLRRVERDVVELHVERRHVVVGHGDLLGLSRPLRRGRCRRIASASFCVVGRWSMSSRGAGTGRGPRSRASRRGRFTSPSRKNTI